MPETSTISPAPSPGVIAGLALHDRGVAVGLRHEADLVRLLLARHVQPCLLGHVAHLGLGHLAEGEERAAELLLRQLEEEVRLILRQVQRLAQLEAAVGVAGDARVVARGDFLRADGARLLVKEIELHVRVAEHARTRREAAQVRLHERRDHLLVKILLEVEREVRDVQLPRHAAGVGEIVDGAASAVGRIGVGEVVVHLHRQTDHLVSGGLEDVRGGRRIDPARHGNGDFHGPPRSAAAEVKFRKGTCCACLRVAWSKQAKNCRANVRIACWSSMTIPASAG